MARASGDQLPAVAVRASAAAESMRLEGIEVRYLRPIFVAEDETCFHVFAASSAEAVSEASRRAALEYDRVVEAVP